MDFSKLFFLKKKNNCGRLRYNNSKIINSKSRFKRSILLFNNSIHSGDLGLNLVLKFKNNNVKKKIVTKSFLG